MQKKEFAYLLNKNNYSIDTMYFKTDSLIVNEKMYATLDLIIKKADSLGFNKSVLKPHYMISTYDDYVLSINGKRSNISILCTDDLEYLNQDFYEDNDLRVPVAGAFIYKNEYFIVTSPVEIEIFENLFSISKKSIQIPYYYIRNIKKGRRIAIFNKQLMVYYKYAKGSFNITYIGIYKKDIK